jgi:Tol biopolymer transport system component
MTEEQWNRLFDVFHAAREKSGEQRTMVLDRACAGDASLRLAAEELLREDDAANGFLSEPLFGPLSHDPGVNPIAAGQRLGRYLTLERIGRGGMGEVWSAQDTDLDRLVALKFLSSQRLAGLDPQQIVREAKAASALNHHGIVTIHEVVQSGPMTALVMELVEGRPLREVCGRPLPVPEVLKIGLRIAEALAAAHANGTIHGDIKPENILLRPDQYVKLLDFGLARKITAEEIGLGIVPRLGTLRYMSPEQARGETLTPASDIFSFGLVLYELLTGQHAFPGVLPLDTAQSILNKEASPPSSITPHIPARLDLLVRNMLIKDPTKRPTAATVERTLIGLLEPPTSRATGWRWGAAGLLLVAVCFAGWRWKERRLASDAATFRPMTTLAPENQATAAAISPDGRFAAYANVDGIFLCTIQTGETRALSAPDDFVVDHLAWFRDGTRLVAGGSSRAAKLPSIWVISATGATPSLIRNQARAATPSPDGTQVAFITPSGLEIWIVGTNGEEPRRVLAGSGSDRFLFVLWSPDGRRLSFQRRFLQGEDVHYEYESMEIATGEVAVEARDLLTDWAAMLPDGRVMFVQWDNREFIAAHELWEMKTNPSTGALEGKPRRFATWNGANTDTMLEFSVSATGQKAVVLLKSTENSTFVGDFDSPPPRINNIRRMTLDDKTDYPHAWTADSRSVIFESDRNGNWDLFRQRIDRHTPETIVATPATEVLPQLAPDGQTVLYAEDTSESRQSWLHHHVSYKLMRVPVEGGTPREVPIGGPLDSFRCALDSGKRCVLRTSVKEEWRTFYDLDPVMGKGRELARTRWSYESVLDWDISPEGTEVALPDHDLHDGRIRVVSLDPRPNLPAEREVVLPDVTFVQSVVWAAGGKGWFVSADTAAGRRLLYVFLDGRYISLGDIPRWAVPSPDGRKVAFVRNVVGANAWLIERR